MLNEELWKDIEGYEGIYQISNMGRVKVLPRFNGTGMRKERIMKISINRLGYQYLTLCKDKVKKKYLIHRLVAKAFIENPNPDKFNQINHIDENRLNNRYDNLEWCDAKYNMNYGNRIKRMVSNIDYKQLGERMKNREDASKKVLNVTTGEVYPSINEASRQTNTRASDICQVCKERRKTANGFKWRYIE